MNRWNRKRVVWMVTLLLLPGLQNHCAGQDSIFTKENFLKGCVAYREKFVHSIVHSVAGFNMMVDSFKPEVTDRRLMERFKEIVKQQFSALGIPSSRESKPESLPDIPGDSDLFALYLEWSMAHAPLRWEFHSMVDNQLIKGEYPYQLLHATELWAEMKFYDFHAHEVIVDVGAGNGFLLFLLRYGNFPATLWMTEIAPGMVVWMKEKAAALDSVSLGNNIHIVTAKEKSIGVPEGTADKVIMRITFHHLNQPGAILSDVHKVLKPGGSLYITEEPKTLNPKEPQCMKVMRKAKIERWIEKGGFEIVEQREAEGIVQYKCRPGRMMR